MATITLPSTTAWKAVEPSEMRSVGRFESPYTYARQEYDWTVVRPMFSFTVPPCKQTAGLAWAEALRELRIPGNTFVADVTNYVGTGTASKSSMTLELVRGTERHYVDDAKIHYISFDAQKSL